MNNEEKILALLEKHSEMPEKQGTLLERHSEMLAQMQGDLAHVKARLDTLKETVGEVKELAEKTGDKVDVIHAIVTQHSKSITELKNAK